MVTETAKVTETEELTDIVKVTEIVEKWKTMKRPKISVALFRVCTVVMNVEKRVKNTPAASRTQRTVKKTVKTFSLLFSAIFVIFLQRGSKFEEIYCRKNDENSGEDDSETGR